MGLYATNKWSGESVAVLLHLTPDAIKSMTTRKYCHLPILLLLWSLTAVVSAQARFQPITIGLFGDTSYSQRERDLLPELMAEMDSEDLAFVIHDGDIKSGGSVCSDEAFLDILGVFKSSRHPLIYVPGDNEWTDCHRRSNGSYDPLERLAKLRSLFYPDEKTLGQRQFELTRQSRDPAFAAYRENVRWEAAGVVFVGLNLPGSDNNYDGTQRGSGPSPEFLQRSPVIGLWLKLAFARARAIQAAGLMVVVQANPGFDAAAAGKSNPGYKDFLNQLRGETLGFAGQVVLVHGDSHHQQINQPLRDPLTQVAIANFTRVETYGSPRMGWIKTTVDARDPMVFRFEARPFQAKSLHPN
jgi:hypothetical protein